jgi:hypothetical protein
MLLAWMAWFVVDAITMRAVFQDRGTATMFTTRARLSDRLDLEAWWTT